MLNKNELRIGNLVKYHDDDTIFKVVEIDTLGIRVKNKEQETWIEYDCFSPINITKDWLIKFGYKFELEWYRYKNEMYIIDEDFMIIVDEVNLLKLNHIHQLQNFHFSVSEQDLRCVGF